MPNDSQSIFREHVSGQALAMSPVESGQGFSHAATTKIQTGL
jgi:hypothetical protein